jgi:hypothetical protein
MQRHVTLLDEHWDQEVAAVLHRRIRGELLSEYGPAVGEVGVAEHDHGDAAATHRGRELVHDRGAGRELVLGEDARRWQPNRWHQVADDPLSVRLGVADEEVVLVLRLLRELPSGRLSHGASPAANAVRG